MSSHSFEKHGQQSKIRLWKRLISSCVVWYHGGKMMFKCILVGDQAHHHEKLKTAGHQDFLLAKAALLALESTFKIHKAVLTVGI